MTTARVVLWGKTIGAVTWEEAQGIALFEYDRAFQSAGIEVSPLTMPAGPGICRFPALSREAFKGLPGMLPDRLPDKFGNAMIDAWLAREGRPQHFMNPVERLCYTGSRGMGALEYQPEAGVRATALRLVDNDERKFVIALPASTAPARPHCCKATSVLCGR